MKKATTWIKIVLLSFAFATVPTMPSLAFQENFDPSTGALEIIGNGTEVLGKRYWRGKMNLRSVTISGIRGIEGADLIQDLGYDGAFVNCSNLLHVTFKGDSLESIGMNCFDHCVNLREIVIPDSVTHIGTSISNVPNNGTFTHCYSVTNIVIGSGLPVIYDDQFRANFMTNLQSVTINGSGHTVLAGSEDGTLHRGGSGTFSGTTVRKVVLRGVASIGIGTAYSGAFSDCTNLTELVFADNCLTNISLGSFRRCRSLPCVTLPEGLQQLGRNAFFGCTSLTNIDFGTGTYSIDADVFQACTALKRADITANITSYGARGTGSIFSDCTNLTYLRVGPGVKTVTLQILPPKNAAPNEVLIEGAGDAVVDFAAFRDSNVRQVRLSGVKRIGDEAFARCQSLESVDFVDCSKLEYIGVSAFLNCPLLASVALPNSTSTTIQQHAFRFCRGMRSFEFGTGEYRFEGTGNFASCSSLTSLTLPDGVKNVPAYLLDDCPAITNVWIGSGVISIGTGACPKGTTEGFGLTIEGAGDAVIEFAAFRESNVRQVRLSGVKRIGDEAFARCQSLESVAFGDCPKLEYIGKIAFSGCPLLGSVTLPNSASTTIENQAFRGCSGMTSFEFGTGEYRFEGGWNFASCTSLTSFMFTDGVKNVGGNIFYDCPSISNIVIGSGIETVSADFRPGNNSALVSVAVNGGGTTALADNAFSGMKINRVVLNGVAKVGSSAFQNNNVLSEVYFDGDAPTVGANAFGGAASDCTAYVPYGSTGWGVDIPLTGKADWNYDGIAGHFIKIAYANAPSGDVGAWLRFDLVDDLGVEIPSDVDYAAGDKVTVKVEGLAKGLKVVATQQKETTGKKAVTNVVYTIEGVPTEAIDFETRPMYARVTVTYKDKTKGDKGKAESLQPIVLSIATPDARELAAGVLNAVYGPVDIAVLWPAVADAKANPKDWSFKGWPAGIKYNNKATAASWSYKDGKATVKTNAEPWTVYGQPTKAGEYPITATWKHKLADGKTTVSETFSAVLTVWGDDGKSEFRYEDQAYVATETKTLDATWKSFSGLPTGIKYTTKLIKADAKKGTPEYPAFSLYGTPTKAGVFAVTATKADPADPAGKKTVKETFLWKIAPATAPTFALDTGTAPVEDLKVQIVQGANQAFAITATADAKVSVSGLPSGLKLVQDKTTKAYSVEGVASKPGEYFVTFKTVLNGVTTVTTTAFTVKGNPFVATYCGYLTARPADGAAKRLAVAEVTVAAAGTVKLTYTEGKTKYTASVKSFDWDDATGSGKVEGLVLKVSSADKQLGYGDRKATLALDVRGTVHFATLFLTDAGDTMLMPWAWDLYATVKETEVTLPASQTFVFRTEDGADTNALATVSVAYDAKKATAAFSGKLSDGTAVKATVPVLRRDDEGTPDDYVFAPFMVIAKDGTVCRFDRFSSDEYGGFIDWVGEDGESVEESWSANAEYALGDRKFAELVPEAGTFTFGWGSDAETVGAAAEAFAFEVTKDKNSKPAGVAIYDADAKEGEKPLATVTAKVGKATGALSVSFTSKKGDKAKYAVELVWRGDQLFAGHVTRTWKATETVGGKPKQVSHTAYGTAEVK